MFQGSWTSTSVSTFTPDQPELAATLPTKHGQRLHVPKLKPTSYLTYPLRSSPISPPPVLSRAHFSGSSSISLRCDLIDKSPIASFLSSTSHDPRQCLCGLTSGDQISHPERHCIHEEEEPHSSWSMNQTYHGSSSGSELRDAPRADSTPDELSANGQDKKVIDAGLKSLDHCT